MPPRFAYWTIMAGGLPTAFRASQREELLPTFKRIQEKHPDAVMKYFARGRLWESDNEAKQAAEARRARGAGGESRGRDWRPGGEHRDPRQKFKDAKKKRNLEWRRERFDRRHRPPAERPHGDPLRGVASRRPAGARNSSAIAGGRKPADVRPRQAGGPPADSKQTGKPRKPAGAPRGGGTGPPGERRPGGPPRNRRRRG